MRDLQGPALLEARPSLTNALVFGVATLVAPWFVMQTGLGFGTMARRLRNRLAELFVTTTTHLAYRFGIYAGVIATAVAAGAAPALAAGLAAGMAEPTIADRDPVAAVFEVDIE